jgi:dTDP-4-amino-4,6-dideoxygalactose transaminase
MPTVPVMRPLLPPAERVVPYLKKLDVSRIYSNYGPLACSLEERLASHFGLADGSVTTVANGTLGLMLALLAQGAVAGTLCLMPAWTFVASAHAAVMAGLMPYFIDVDGKTWMLDPDAVVERLADAPAAVGAVMAVAPFGRPVDIKAWDRFRSRTTLPVVIDAAAGFDGLRAGETPAVVSLHATKVMAVGEGGFVVSSDTSLIRDIRARANFGFSGTRHAIAAASNAKLSEYHAAVGHAAMDEWPQSRAQWLAAAHSYLKVFGTSNRLRLQEAFGRDWVATTCVVSIRDSPATRVEGALAKAEIDTRYWWGKGAHAHPATSSYPRDSLPVTEMLGRCTLGLPFYRDLGSEQIERIGRVVLAAVEG